MRHESRSRWKEPLPAWLTGMLRTFAWLGALGLIYLVGSVAASMKLANHYPACEAQMSYRNDGSALDRTRGFLSCLKDRAGLLDGMTLKSISHFVEPMPLTPQAYRGSWIATRPGSRWRIELRDDGSFAAEQLQGPPTMQGVPMTGVWSVVDEHFVWLYDEGQVWPPDINPIRDAYSGSFNLREKDRSLTHYERERL